MDLNRPVAVPYTQGNWEGELGSDLLRFVEGPNATVRVNVASIMSSENFYINGSMWEGILGLGYPRLSKVSRFWTSSSIALVTCLPTAAAYNPSLMNPPSYRSIFLQTKKYSCLHPVPPSDIRPPQTWM